MPYILKCFSVSMVTQEKTAIRLTLASVIVYWTVGTSACTLPPSSSYSGSDHVGNRKTSVLLRGSGVPRPEGIIPLEIWIYSGASPELDVPGRSPKGGTHTGDLSTSTGSLHTSKVLLCRCVGMSVCMYPHVLTCLQAVDQAVGGASCGPVVGRLSLFVVVGKLAVLSTSISFQFLIHSR